MDIYKYVNRTENPVVFYSTVLNEERTIEPYGEIVLNASEEILDSLEGIQVDRYVNQVATPSPVDFNSRSPVISSAQGGGIRVNPSNPSYTWRDLLSPTVIYSGASSNKPTFDDFLGTGIRQYAFAVGDESFHHFHLPHDYVPNSQLFLHVHWTSAETNVMSWSNSIVWTVTAAHGPSHSGMSWSFSSPMQIMTILGPNNVHNISEIPLTGIGWNPSMIQPDDIIEVRLVLTVNPGIPKVFMHYCDLHYQSTNIGTLNKTPNYYGI